ncbi:hypothetical protein NV391_09300 [Companilactobacillus crustorum]|uniref:hypothetical protein n=1 Tax=Companilactobacillus crustorum TaxID=392416 RepID=UPI00237D650E|nr:hypothetical protein [Companilactobacillus crustorum]WDT65155.1 hypothetical protein NV391_09300 [Companilactobacillus crustorum]
MNNVNIFQELEDLRYRKNISQRKIAILCNVKPASAGEWFTKHHVDDKYLWIIANSEYGDDRFLLALLCYELRLSNTYLNSLRKSKEDSLSTLISTQLEDSESDVAITNLMNLLSVEIPNKEAIGSYSMELYDTGLKMILSAANILKSEGISVAEALLERREVNNARA